MKNKHSNYFYKTTNGELAEAIHDKHGVKIGEQIICSSYPSIYGRLIKDDNTVIYRLKVEVENDEQYMFDFSPAAYRFSPSRIKYKLAKIAIFPITGMDRRFNVYLKRAAERIRDTMDEKPWHPIN